MRFNLSSLFALVVAASTVAAQPAKRSVTSVNPPRSQVQPVDLTALPPADVTPATNAKRFAQGLPPLSPVRRQPHRGGPHRDGGYPHGGTHVVAAPRAETSSIPPTNTKCSILVKAGASTLGYIAANFNDYGEYGHFQDSQAGALEVSFSNSGSASGPVDFLASTPPPAIDSFPYMSAAKGFMSDGDDLGPGSSNYVVVGGNSGSTGSGATPSSSTSNSYATKNDQDVNSETAIWTYDPATQDIRIVWTNTDGSSVPTKLLYFIDTNPDDGDANTLVATGDVGAFREVFGCTDTCPEVTYTCVPPPASN